MVQKYSLLGTHVSVSGSFVNGIHDGEKLGCTAIQIFTKSNRQWASKKITEKEAKEFIQTQKSSCITTVIAHASYLINLASEKTDLAEKSYQALVEEINRCHQLNINSLILHPGTGTKNTASLEQIAHFIQKALDQTTKTPVSILIETMAGQGNSRASSFEELGYIIKKISSQNRIGVCFDTCHVFAAGYNLNTDYEKILQDFDAAVGINFIKTIHMNNSKKECGSRVDRHENIGTGMIDINVFKKIMNDHRFFYVPKILETPKSDDLELDRQNLKILHDLIL